MKNQCFFLVCLTLNIASSASAQAMFTRITNSPVVTDDPGMFYAGVWGDFNNDGFLDLFVSNYGGRTNDFYLNNGNGAFAKVTQRRSPSTMQTISVFAAAAADYDNDGYLDLVVVAAGVDAAPTARHNRLYHNNGDGTFASVSGGALTNELGFCGACAWADYDRDGFVDVVIVNHGNPSSTGGTNFLFHNNGNGTFSKITTGSIVHDVTVSYGASWEDYDNDGYHGPAGSSNAGNSSHQQSSVPQQPRRNVYKEFLRTSLWPRTHGPTAAIRRGMGRL